MNNGYFVWRDLQSTDVNASQAFFTTLFGWTTEPVEMGGMTYTMFGLNGQNFGGFSELDASVGAPSRFVSYLTVEDVDAAVATAAQNGASLLFGPDDIPGIGRFAAIADPQGAVVNLFHDANPAPISDVLPTPIGAVSWNELETSDPAAAVEFYGKLVDWTFEKTTSPGGDDYWLAKQDGANRAGFMAKPPMLPVSAWFIYFAVADIDASVAKVKALGGQIWMDVMNIEGIGKVAYGADPTGTAFAMIQEAPM
jgi:predicted enzyme related to lactoylglutathione lyase